MKVRVLCLIIAATVITSNSAFSQGRWHYESKGYLWLMNIQGTVGNVQVEPAFEDIYTELDGGGSFTFEASKDKNTYIFDLAASFVNKKTGGSNAVDIDQNNAIVSGIWGYEPKRDLPLDLLVGFRHWATDTRLTNGVKIDQGWTDIMVGLKGTYPVSDKVGINLWGLVGAGASESEWELRASFDTILDDKVSWTLGYRAMGVEYTGGGYPLDTVQYGWLFGLAMRY